MPYIDFTSKKVIKIRDGIAGTFHHSTQATFGYITLQIESALPEHSHIHEQWTHVIEGELLFNIGGDEKLFTAGMTAFIPSNLPHSAKAITQCKVIDCFLPVREDFVALEKQQ